MHLLSIVLFSWLVPSAHMQTDSETFGVNTFSSLQINIMASSGRVGVEVRVMRS